MRIRIVGDEVLREKAAGIEKFDEELKQLVEEMFDTMHEADGIGLAAPQVGLSIRLLVTDTSELEKGTQPTAFINPQIVASEGESTFEEGCLSIPGVREEVTRPEKITLEYQTVDGVKKKEDFEGWQARVLQHEIDHLDGVLFIDYLSPVKKKLIASQLTAAQIA